MNFSNVLLSFLDYMTDMVAVCEIVFDKKGNPVNYRIIDCNSAFSSLTGLAKEGIVGKLATEVYQTKKPPYLKEFSEVVLTGEPCSFDAYYPQQNINAFTTVVLFDSGKLISIAKNKTLPGISKTVQESDARIRELAEKMPVLINAITKDAKFTFWNKTCEDVTGFSREEIIDNPAAMRIIYPDKAYREKLAIDWQESGFLFQEKEALLRNKDGSVRHILWTNLPQEMSFSAGDIWAVGVDITESKIVQQELHEEQAFLQIILNLATDFINVPFEEFDSKIGDMLGRIGEYTKMDRVYVNRHDYDRQVSSETHEWCAEGISSQIIKSQNTPFALFIDLMEIMQKGEMVHIPVVAQMPDNHPMRPIFEQQGIKSIFALPMINGKQNTGFVGFSSVRETRNFTEREKALLKVLAEMIANAFSRKYVEEALAEKNEMLSILNLCSLQQAEAQTYDRLTEIIYEQLKQYTNMVGFIYSDYDLKKKALVVKTIKAEQKIVEMGIRLIGKKPFKIEMPIDDDFYKEITTDIVGYRSTMAEASAGVIPEQISSAIQKLSGVNSIIGLAHVIEGSLYGVTSIGLKEKTTNLSLEFLKSYAYISAISLRRLQAEETLRQNEQHLREIIDLVPHFIFVKDMEGRFILVNESVAEAYGTTVDELTGMTDGDFAQSEDEVDHFRKHDLAVIESGEPDYVPEETITDSKGRLRYLSTTKIPFTFSEDNNSAVLGVSVDITERKYAEKALIESEKRYREILETIEEGYYETDLRGNFVFCNNSLCKMFGYERDELIGLSYKRLYRNPDLVYKTYNRVYTTGTPEKAAGWVIETKDKRDIFVELSITLYRDHQDIPIGFRGVARDITERNRAEEALRYMSLHDQLTGLYNRSFLEAELGRLNTARQLPLTVIMADLNGLKMINDTYGHAYGDEMLKAAVAVIKSCCREEDIIARWGGDEFVILLPLTETEKGEEICKRITARCGDIYVKYLPLSIALGMASKNLFEEDTHKILHEAENDMYKQKLAESRSARSAVLNAFIKTLAEKSPETETHTRRMKEVALSIGRKISLPDSELNRLELLVTLHDIGKINISEEVLTKRESLTLEEWEIMRRHPEMGYRITRATEDFAHVANDILAHHESWDGSGYPQGLKGDEIPLLARITAIADAYEVMTNGRPYKLPLSRNEVIAELKSCAGTRYDPELIEVFLSLSPNIS